MQGYRPVLVPPHSPLRRGTVKWLLLSPGFTYLFLTLKSVSMLNSGLYGEGGRAANDEEKEGGHSRNVGRKKKKKEKKNSGIYTYLGSAKPGSAR